VSSDRNIGLCSVKSCWSGFGVAVIRLDLNVLRITMFSAWPGKPFQANT